MKGNKEENVKRKQEEEEERRRSVCGCPLGALLLSTAAAAGG